MEDILQNTTLRLWMYSFEGLAIAIPRLKVYGKLDLEIVREKTSGIYIPSYGERQISVPALMAPYG